MAQKVVIDIDVKSNKGIKNVNELNNSLGKTSKKQKELKKSTKDTTKALDKSKQSSQRNAAAFEGVNKATGGAIRGVRSLIKQMWLLVANPIGAVVAALVLGLSALFKAFSSTKAGGEKLDQLMAGIGATIDVLRDRVLKVGTAILKFFSGDFKGALKAGKEAVSGFGEEVSREFKQAADATKNLQEVADAARMLSVSRAELNRDLIKAKEIIEGGTASYNEKKKAIEQVREAETKQTEQELKNAQKKLDAIVLANSLSDSGTEDLEKEAQARIAVANLEAESSRNKTKFNKLAKLADNEELARIKQIAADKKAINDKAIADAKKNAADKKAIDDKAIADKKTIQKLEANTEEEKRVLALEKEKEKFDAAILLATEQGLSTEELERSQKESLELMRDEFHKKDIDAKQKNTDESNKIAKEQKDYKEQQYRSTYSNLQTILSVGGKKLEKVGKALAIADVIRSSVKSVSETVSATGVANAKAVAASPLTGGMPFVAINSVKAALSVGATIAGAAKSIQSIKGNSKNVSPPPALPNPGGGGGGGSIPSIPPAFNVVGASDTNQLASAIGGQSQQPVQAFVVSNDVTTAQEMDRNIIEGASI